MTNERPVANGGALPAPTGLDAATLAQDDAQLEAELLRQTGLTRGFRLAARAGMLPGGVGFTAAVFAISEVPVGTPVFVAVPMAGAVDAIPNSGTGVEQSSPCTQIRHLLGGVYQQGSLDEASKAAIIEVLGLLSKIESA